MVPSSDPPPPARPRGDGRRSCAAVLVHWTDAEETLAAVASLRASCPGLGIVIVDNASEDGSGAVVQRGVPEAVYVRAPRNEGFGPGANLGISAALAHDPGLDHVLVMNPDVRVAPEAVPELLRAGGCLDRAGVVGARLLKGVPPDRDLPVWFESGRLAPWTLSGSHVPGPAGAVAAGQLYGTGFVTGALMLLSGDMLREGLRFRDDLFLYGEDLDLCLQARARGWSCLVAPAALGWHREAGSQGESVEVLPGMDRRRLYWITRNKVALARSWLPWHQRCGFLVVAFLAKPLAGVLRYGRVRFLSTYLRALWHGLRRGPAGGDATGRRGG